MNAHLSFQARILLGCLAAVLCTLLAVAVLLEGLLGDQITEGARDSMRQQLALTREVVKDRWSPGDTLERSEALTLDLGRRLGLRVTLIGLDGRVLGDSDLQLKEVEALESHAGRPEVIQALAQGRGESVRYSGTLAMDLLYAALPLGGLEDPRLVIRLAMPLAQVQRAREASRRLVAAAFLLGALFSLGVAYLVARGINRPVADLTRTVRALAAGDLGVRLRRYAPHEIGELGRAFDRMADNLQARMDDLALAHDRQEAILRAMVEGVMLVDHQGVVLLVNQALPELLGLSGDPIGRPFSEVVRIPDLHEALAEVLGGAAQVVAEVRCLAAGARHLEIHLVRVERDAIRSGAVAVFHDVSERRRMEQMRRDLVANTSHELRTPLAAIKGAAETLLEGALDSPPHARQFVEMIRRHAGRLERLGEDLLSLARLEAGEVKPQMEDIALADLARGALAMMDDLARQRGVALRALLPERPPGLRADKRQVEQALLNLLDNAIKYTDPGGEVTLSVEARGGQVVLAVADTGPGIAREHLPRLFERFYRVDKNRSRQQGGTGLGLAIVKHIAQAHGGRVEVESALGRGSEFRLILPADPAPVHQKQCDIK